MPKVSSPRFLPGNIVLVPFPFTHFDSEKIRPALILSPKNTYDDYIVLFLTSQVKKYSDDLQNILIVKNADNGLVRDTMVITTKIATLSEQMILEKLGTLKSVEFKKVQKMVSKVLGL